MELVAFFFVLLVFMVGFGFGRNGQKKAAEPEQARLYVSLASQELLTRKLQLREFLLLCWQEHLLGDSSYRRILERAGETDQSSVRQLLVADKSPELKQALRQQLHELQGEALLLEAEYADINAWLDSPAFASPERMTPVAASGVEEGSEDVIPASAPVALATAEAAAPVWKLEKSTDELDRFRNFSNYFFETGKANWLTFLGVLLVVGSSLPLIQSTSSSSLIYGILLLYSLGLFGAGLGVYRYFPWTGQVFYLVTLLIVPVDFMSISGLDLSLPGDLMLSLFAFGSLTLVTRQILKTLSRYTSSLYLLILVALGLSAAFTRELEHVVADFGGDRQSFELLVLLLPFGFLLIGLIWQNRQLKIDSGQSNQAQILLLNALLVYAWVMTPAVNNLGPELWDLAAWLLCLAGWYSVLHLRKTLNASFGEHWPPGQYRRLLSLELCVHGLGLVTLGLSFGLNGHPAWITGLTGLVCWIYSYSWRDSWYVRLFSGAAAALLGACSYLAMTAWLLPHDSQALISAAVSMALILLARAPLPLALASWWRSSLHSLAALYSFTTWALIARLGDWSLQTLAAMGLTAGVYILYALWRQRNVFGYLAIVTVAITAFSSISVLEPLLDFEAYRLYAMYLSFGFLAAGYAIQSRSPLATGEAAQVSPVTRSRWQRLLGEDLIQPFHFQQRFASPLPYIFSEPLYNLGLLMTSLALLMDLGDSLPAAVAAVFFGLIFMVYPSRIWIYFVITAATGGLLDLIEDALPGRYHNWGFLFLSMGWFFVGSLVEELLSAHDRRKPDPDHRMSGQQAWARPFFHGALFANLLLLKYYFGDLQHVFDAEGWRKLSEEILPMALTSFFYVLKLRVYVSKLWLYPGLITATLGLYFGLGGLLPAEANLLLLSAIAWLWLGLGTLFNRSRPVQDYLREMVRHRLPDIDPESRFYLFHIHDFGSPFYAFAFLIAAVVLALSTALIPQQSAVFNHEFAFALSLSNPATLYLCQLLNFAALSAFFLLHYPVRIPQLVGGFETRVRPAGLAYLPILSLTLGLLWLGSEALTLRNLGLVLALLALVWLGLSQLWQLRTGTGMQPALRHSVLVLCAGAFIYSLPEPSSLVLATLPLLAISFGWLLAGDTRPGYVYGLFASLGLEMAAVPLLWPDASPYSLKLVPLCFFGLLTALTLLAHRRQAPFAFHYLIMAQCLGFLTPCFILGDLLQWKDGLLPGAPGAVLVLWLGVFALMALLLELFTDANPGWSLLALFTAVLVCLYSFPWSGLPLALLAPAGYWVWTRLRHGKDHWSALAELGMVLAQVLPPLVFIRLFLLPLGLAESPGTYLLRLLSLAPLLGGYAWLAHSQRHKAQWWWLAFMANWGWIYAWGAPHLEEPPPQSVGLLIAWHLLFVLPGLSLVLLGRHTLSKPNEKNQLSYIGLFLIYLPALLGLAISASLPLRIFSGLEFLLLTALLCWLSTRLKLRALLYMALTASCCFILGGGVYVFATGGLLGRWSLFIGLGAILIATGTLFQARADKLQLAFNRLYGQLVTWS